MVARDGGGVSSTVAPTIPAAAPSAARREDECLADA
jgi:hypothetical protein